MRTREVPWLGAGTEGEWTTTTDALYESGLLYEVEQTNAYDDAGRRVPCALINRRKDTGDILGMTSDNYGLIQNEDAFGLLDPFCSAGGIIEHAGMVGTTGMIFMVMRIPADVVELKFGGDPFDLYVCAMNSFNTKFPCAVIITPVRVFCQNMFRRLYGQSDHVFSAKHSSLSAARITSAKAAVGALTGYTEHFNHLLSTAVHMTRTSTDVEKFVARMFPMTPEDKYHPRAKFTNERVEQQRELFLSDYYGAPDNEEYLGTKLGLINAYYDWVSHSDPRRMMAGFEDRRLSNLMSGTAIDVKLIESA